ncbi:MAG: ZIP family metal transporter [Clostridia bacterium]|nr:ZIP family metal transporter [Clostridia bacterium]MDD4686396.1 ZIP family metal transporter [Clostridia bacterium]
MEWFISLSPVLQTLIATLFTWSVTALGALFVCFFKKVNKKVLDMILGFGAGVMIAASFWSLLSPAIDGCEALGQVAWLIPAIGFLCGGLLVVFADKFLDNMLLKRNQKYATKHESWRRSILLVSAVTIHNIPEGMAIGIAFGSAALGLPGATLLAAVMLTIGIGLQNFPEGAAVSLPLRREGYPIGKCFFYGQATAFVEPIAGLIGVVAAITMQNLLPFLLSFAAGAMICVVMAELVPESTRENKGKATTGIIVGFIIMMILDVALG